MGLWDGIRDIGDRIMGRPFLPPRYVALCEESFTRRMAFWESLGEVYILGYDTLDFRDGSPDWPSLRRGYVVVNRGDRVLIATDSLSDPFLFEKRAPVRNGAGFELIIEAPASVFPPLTSEDPTAICPAWPFDLLFRLASNMPLMLPMAAELRSGLVASTEIEPAGVAPYGVLPPGYVADNGAVGLLAGGVSPGLPAFIPDMPLSDVRILPLTILTSDELSAARTGRGHAHLLAEIQFTGQVNDPARPSTVRNTR